MSEQAEFKAYVLDQLAEIGAFETKALFGGTALLRDGAAFAKIKSGALWLKVDDQNRPDFEAEDMPQYSYGKDNSRHLNFFQTPPDVLEDTGPLAQWVTKAIDASQRSKTK